MNLCCSTYCFSLPKNGNCLQENEDSYAIYYDEQCSSIRLSITDGATESSFSKEWAALLADHFVSLPYPTANKLSATLPHLSSQWRMTLKEEKLPWYAAQKLEQGAFAAFLGVEINLQTGKMELLAIGDCNLTVIRKEKFAFHFPIQYASGFNNTPALLGTNHHSAHTSPLHREEFELKTGDLVFIGSDAIARWVLEQPTLLPSIEEIMITLSDDNRKLSEWIKTERDLGRLKNDDTTFILLKITYATSEG